VTTADRLTPARRSENMRRIKSKDTSPEWAVRRMIHGLGFRYRLHRRDLPGSPDLVFTTKRKAVFVHGCFWHAHGCKRGGKTPVGNANYWAEKLRRNRARDRKTLSALRRTGWHCMVIWECHLKKSENLKRRLVKFLTRR